MDDIMAILAGGQLTNENKLKATADALRGEQRAANLLSMSTLEPLAGAAKQRANQITNAANQAGAARRQQLKLATEEERRKADRAAEVSDLNKKLENDQLVAMLKKDGTRALGKPTDKTIQSYMAGQEMLGRIKNINDIKSDFTPEQLGNMDKWYKSVITDLSPDFIAQKLEEGLYGSDPDVRDYLINASLLEQRLSQAAAGLALTKYEIAERRKWSPMAPGISAEERQRRLDMLQEDFNRQIAIRNKMYPQLADIWGGGQPQGQPQGQPVPQQQPDTGGGGAESPAGFDFKSELDKLGVRYEDLAKLKQEGKLKAYYEANPQVRRVIQIENMRRKRQGK